MTRPHRRRVPVATKRVSGLVEPLELRRLLAVDPGGTATIDGSTPRLDVEGTRRADDIRVDLNATTNRVDVVINGAAAGSFDLAQIAAGVRVDGRAGNDTIAVGSGIPLAVEVMGDKGHDNITGGTGADRIDGGVGNDRLSGGDSNDVLTGGRGRDVLAGGLGDDRIDGGAGNDDCDGGSGNDTVRGDVGRDRVRGGGDNDDVFGGGGNDDLAGDDGSDTVRGDDGRDSCDGGSGDDSVHGGRGRDRVRGGAGDDDFDESPDGRGRDGDRSDEIEDRGGDDGVHIPLSELPAAVSAAFNTQFPGATIRGVERETEDGGIQYKIDFISTGGQRIRARYNEAGVLVRQDNDDDGNGGGGGGGGGGGNDDNHIPVGELPPADFAAFNTRYPGAAIREVERETEDGGIIYKIDFNRDGRRVRAEFNAVGQFLREEIRD